MIPVSRLDFNLEKFYSQSNLCAAISRILGEILEYEQPADLYTVSLLHNIGKLVIAFHFAEEHKAIKMLKQKEDILSYEAERRILGSTHAEIGALFWEEYNIPQELCNAVKYHDTGEDNLFREESCHQLVLLLRKSTTLVDKRNITESMIIEPLELFEKMRNTVAEGQEICRELKKKEIKAKGYQEVFNILSAQASFLVEKDIQNIIQGRDTAV